MWLWLVRRSDLGWFPFFLSSSPAKNRVSEGLAVKEASSGLVRPTAHGKDLALRALTVRHCRLKSRKTAWTLERRTAADGPGDTLNPTPRGERPRVQQARLDRWLLLDQVQPPRRHYGGDKQSAAGMGCPAAPPWRSSAARRPGTKRRPEASGIKAAWTQLGTKRGRSPRARRRNAPDPPLLALSVLAPVVCYRALGC